MNELQHLQQQADNRQSDYITKQQNQLNLLQTELIKTIQQLDHNNRRLIGSLEHAVMSVNEKVKTAVTDEIKTVIQQTTVPTVKAIQSELDKQLNVMRNQTKAIQEQRESFQKQRLQFFTSYG